MQCRDRHHMFTKWLTRLLLVAALMPCGARAADRIAANDIRFTFTQPPVVPDRDIPKAARRAGITPDPDAKKGPPPQIEFGIVRDPGSHGALFNVVAGRIAAITVTWSDTGLLQTPQDTVQFLRRLLTTPTGSTYTHVPWAQMLGVPSVAATVNHTEGKPGARLVWYGWPSIYCAYQDGAGKWWFAAWFQDEDVRLETKNTELSR